MGRSILTRSARPSIIAGERNGTQSSKTEIIQEIP